MCRKKDSNNTKMRLHAPTTCASLWFHEEFLFIWSPCLQTLAVYDRFGRLLHGSEVVARDVLEYVVFEKHVASTYGLWRIHDKIIPDWMPPRQSTQKTYKVKEMEEEEEPPLKDDSLQDATSEPESGKEKPTVALA